MANPTRYERGFSFAGFQANSPQKPLPGQKLDIELDNLERTAAGVVEGLADIRRSDGALKNGIVTFDALSPGLFTGIQPVVAWLTSTRYPANATVFFETAFYRAQKEHVSGVFADDFDAGLWYRFADLTPIVDDADAARDAAQTAATAASLSATSATSAAGTATAAAGTATAAAGEASTSAASALAAASAAAADAGTATTAAGTATTKATEAAASAADAAGAVAGRVAKAGDTMAVNANLVFQGTGGVDLAGGAKLRATAGRLYDDTQPIWSGHFFPSLDKIIVTVGQGVDDAFSDEVVLQAAIDAASVRGQIVQLSSGIWRLVSTLQMKSKVALIVPPGALLTTSNTAIGDTIQCNGISDFVIEGLTINGPSPGPYGGGTSNTAGISILNGSQRGRVLGCVVRDYLGNGINLNVNNVDCAVDHNRVENCRVGISAFKGNQRAKIRGNSIANCHDIGINIDDATSSDTSGTASPNFRTLVLDNHLTFIGYNAGANGIAVQGSFYTIVRGNSIESCGKGPATWVSAVGIAVNGGQANHNLAGYSEVHGNIVNDCTAAGISIGSSESTDVQGNQVLDNWQWQTALSGDLGEVEVKSAFGGGTINNSSVLNNRLYLTKSGSSRSTHCIVNDGGRTRIGGNTYRNASASETVQTGSQVDWLGVEQLESLPTNGIQAGRVVMNRATGALSFHNGGAWVAA